MKAHYYTANVQTYQGRDSGVAVHTPTHATLEAALRDGIEVATYYILECGYSAHLSITKVCKRCEGVGTIRVGRRVIRTKSCPDCRGNAEETIVNDFQVSVHENAVSRHPTV
jgi:hypothetical protein